MRSTVRAIKLSRTHIEKTNKNAHSKKCDNSPCTWTTHISDRKHNGDNHDREHDAEDDDDDQDDDYNDDDYADDSDDDDDKKASTVCRCRRP